MLIEGLAEYDSKLVAERNKVLIGRAQLRLKVHYGSGFFARCVVDLVRALDEDALQVAEQDHRNILGCLFEMPVQDVTLSVPFFRLISQKTLDHRHYRVAQRGVRELLRLVIFDLAVCVRFLRENIKIFYTLYGHFLPVARGQHRQNACVELVDVAADRGSGFAQSFEGVVFRHQTTPVSETRVAGTCRNARSRQVSRMTCIRSAASLSISTITSSRASSA
jgi:hypothetical protein